MCISGGLCATVCSDHWADCNHDYTDGCETASDEGRCNADEVLASDPVADITCQRESSFSEPYDATFLAMPGSQLQKRWVNATRHRLR
ncbi:MAG: hypothetical protein RL701_2291 [Pseudomonadota bacterium]|jgi:hypothetical protein